MSFVTSGKKWHRAAAQAGADIEGLQAQQADLDFGRSMLSNIREIRIAQAQQQAYMSTGIQSSTEQGSVSNIKSALGGAAGHAYDTSVRNEEIQYLAGLVQRFSKKGSQMDKRAATAGKIMGAGAAALSYIPVIGPILGALAAGANAGAISLMGGDSVAQKAALSTTLSGFNYAGAFSSIGNAFSSSAAAGSQAAATTAQNASAQVGTGIAESSGWAASSTVNTGAGMTTVMESGGQALSAYGSGGALVDYSALTSMLKDTMINKSFGGFFGSMFSNNSQQLPGGRQSVVFSNYNPQGGSLMYRQGY